MRPIKILVTDDDRSLAHLMVKLLSEIPEFDVVGAAGNGKQALAMIAERSPDFLILDLEMPVMNGLETLTAVRAQYPHVKVIMFSSYTKRGAVQTLQALSRGALDYAAKPTGGLEAARNVIAESLVPKIRAVMNHNRNVKIRYGEKESSTSRTMAAGRHKTRAIPSALVIGASTGGPHALDVLLAGFPASFPVPILVVQHMSALFTTVFASHLAGHCRIAVTEGTHGASVQPGQAVIAPGDHHMELRRNAGGVYVHLNQDPPTNYCRPSLDPMFISAAQMWGTRLLGVVLTGMGRDGLHGCKAIHEAGGQVFAQDQASSVLWGMPGAVVKAGVADRVLPLDELTEEILKALGIQVTEDAMEPHRALN